MELVVNPKINKNELIELYKSVGWTADVNNIDNLRKGMKKSYVIAAYEDKKLIGLVRALSDYATFAELFRIGRPNHRDGQERRANRQVFPLFEFQRRKQEHLRN